MGVIVTSAIGYSVGFLAAFVITILYLVGKLDLSDANNIGYKLCGSCCLGTQFIMFLVVALIIMGQKTELAERKDAITNMSFVNECGDEFT